MRLRDKQNSLSADKIAMETFKASHFYRRLCP
jgi:hypothetical protein